MLHVLVMVLAALLTVFSASSVYLLYRALRQARREHALTGPPPGPPRSVEQRARDFVAPAHAQHAMLGPRRRVGVEFFTSLCGFPGFGWIASGRVALGVTLMTAVPAFVWAIYPIILSVNGRIADGPFVAVRYLPALAVLSSATLALVEWRTGKGLSTKVETTKGGEVGA